jgi:hypothetical protein
MPCAAIASGQGSRISSIVGIPTLFAAAIQYMANRGGDEMMAQSMLSLWDRRNLLVPHANAISLIALFTGCLPDMIIGTNNTVTPSTES